MKNKKIYVVTPVNSKVNLGTAEFYDQAIEIIVKLEMWDTAAGMYQKDAYTIHLIDRKELINFK
jgi:hypothetical protein